MGQQTERIDHLINTDLLDAFFDEWMSTNFHTITASGDKIVVIDKDGTRTETNDLAAAAKAAKVEWDDTYKPQIESAISTAGSDHTRAESDHSTASSDHSTAQSDHSTAQSDHTTAGNDHTQATAQTTLMEAWNTHLPFIGDGTTGDLNYWYAYNPSTEQYVKGPYAKGDDLHWDEMSEAEKEDLADKVADAIVFASVETCESIIDELT